MTFGAFKDKDERMTSEEIREAQIEEIRNMDRPNFKDEKVNKFLDEFEGLLENYKAKIQAEDEQEIDGATDAYYEWMSRLSEIMQEQENDEKVKLASYMAQ